MDIKSILKTLCMIFILIIYIGSFILYSCLVVFCEKINNKEKENKMKLEKFYQTQTGELVYVVTGAKNRLDAFKFVSQYKKMNYDNMTLTHKIIRGRLSKNNEVYTYSSLKYVDGVDCWIIARNSIELNSNKFKEVQA